MPGSKEPVIESSTGVQALSRTRQRWGIEFCKARCLSLRVGAMGLGGFNGILSDFRAEDSGSVFLGIYQHVKTAHSSSIGI